MTKQQGERGYRFHPPRHVPWAMALAECIGGLFLRKVMGVVRLEIAPADLERLRALKGQRVMLTPNHPSYEPIILYWLSRRLRQCFSWLAAREVFEQWHQGWLVSRVGAFSIDRGVHDERAKAAMRQVLVGGDSWLVLFPEGQEYYLHDTILPFLPGAARTAFDALEQIRSQGGNQPLYIVPIALRYYYAGDMRMRIGALLTRLEEQLGLSAVPPVESCREWFHARLSRIADRVLDANEELYGLAPLPEASIAERLDRLRELIIERSATTLGVDPPPCGSPLRNRLRKLFVAANELIHAPPGLAGSYAQEMHARRVRRAQRVKAELRRVLQFVALTDAYALEVPTAERFMDTLGRLEAEVFGKLRFYPPRVVNISVGDPINVSLLMDDWKARGESAAEALMERIESDVRSLLASTADKMTLLPG